MKLSDLARNNRTLFSASDEFGGALNSIKTSSPTFSPYEFLHYFDSIRFSNGGIDNGTPLSDAISVALVSLQATSEIPNKKKHIVLFTNTEYYSTPVQLFNKFNNSSLSDLMQTIKQESINFSIIAPRYFIQINATILHVLPILMLSIFRKMYALKKIFVEATGLQTSHLGIDQAHMILLMNLGLPENKIEETKPIPESIPVQSKQINQQAVDESQTQQQQDYQNNNSQQLQDHHQLQQGQQQGQSIQHNPQLQAGQQIPNQQNPSEQNDANIQTVMITIFSKINRMI